MVWMESSFKEFLEKTEKKKIVCYGAGMLPLYLEPLFEKYHIAERICCFLDGNPEKDGQEIELGKRRLPIKNKEALREFYPEEGALLVTAEKYHEILRSLEQLEEFKVWDCYVWPLLNLSCFRESVENLEVGEEDGLHNSEAPVTAIRKPNSRKIPKTIHYTWFGRGEKTPLMKRCIESWRNHCPDFTIQEWNEDNYDISGNIYMKQAYEAGKWAYVSDFARLDILYQHGGIYLDTDVELFQSIKNICSKKGFVCAGEWPVPNSGAGIGCVPGHPLVKEMMKKREEMPFFDMQGRGDCHTNSNYEMEVLLRHGFSMDFTLQCREGFVFYPPDVIAPVSITGEDSYVTARTIGKHHCNNSWRKEQC